MHPLNSQKLRDLAETLMEASAGRRFDRAGLEQLIAELMVCLRDDLSCDGAGGVADRLLGIADHRLGGEAMVEAAYAELMAAPGPPRSPPWPTGTGDDNGRQRPP